MEVNGLTIWTDDQSVDSDPPEYIKELVKDYKGYDDKNPANKVIYSRIDSDSVSVTYADLHGIRWDKKGNVIATYTTDEDGKIISADDYTRYTLYRFEHKGYNGYNKLRREYKPWQQRIYTTKSRK